MRLVRDHGLAPKQILKILLRGGGRRRRADIAKEWCEALGMTEKEAKKLAG